MSLLKLLYYIALGITSLLSAIYFLVGLYDFTLGGVRSKAREGLIMAIATCVTLALLYWAFRLGHQQHQWGYGLGIIALAIVVFLVIFIGGMFMFGNVHWQ